jgi:hypothetical protein
MAISLGMLVIAMPARAQQEGAAESLFRQGREDMKRGQHEAACPKFEESYRLDPSLGTLLNLSLCEEALGHTATAWTKLRQFLDAAPEGDSRLRIARKHIAALEPRLSWVHLIVEQDAEQMTVELDGVELRGASLSQAIPVNPGDHSVRIRRPSGESNETQFQVRAAEKLELQLQLPARQSPPVSVTPPQPLPATIERPATSIRVSPTSHVPNASNHNTKRAIAYSVGAVGVAGLVTGSVFGLMALKDKNVVHEHCPNHECQDQAGLDAVESGARNETVSNVAFIVGALGLLTGGALLWQTARTSATLSVGTNSASLVLVGTIQ